MYSLSFKHSQPFLLLKHIARPEKIKIQDDTLVLKNKKMSGYFKAFALQNGTQCLCAKYSTREDFHLYKKPIASEFFTLRIHEISQACNSFLMTNRKYKTDVHPKSNSVLLMSSLEEFAFFASKNSKVKTLEISIPPECFLRQLNMECSYELLKKYMALETRKTQIDCSNDEFKTLFFNIISEANNETIDINYLEENVNSLLTIFFSDVTSNLNDFLEVEKVKISRDEIRRLMAVKKHLEKDISSPPPKFSSLTRMALMSGTSLKTKFRKMYGITVFEYFQKMRMQKARVLLLTHKYSVKEIGCLLGYANLSNFTIAFKKEFNQLPRQLLKQY